MWQPHSHAFVEGYNSPQLLELTQYLNRSDKYAYYKWQSKSVLDAIREQEAIKENTIEDIKSPVLMILGE